MASGTTLGSNRLSDETAGRAEEVPPTNPPRGAWSPTLNYSPVTGFPENDANTSGNDSQELTDLEELEEKKSDPNDDEKPTDPQESAKKPDLRLSVPEDDEDDTDSSDMGEDKFTRRRKPRGQGAGPQTPPLNSIWHPATLQAKSNREKQEKWLRITGRNPKLPYYKDMDMTEMRKEISKLMKLDANRRARGQVVQDNIQAKDELKLAQEQVAPSFPPQKRPHDDGHGEADKVCAKKTRIGTLAEAQAAPPVESTEIVLEIVEEDSTNGGDEEPKEGTVAYIRRQMNLIQLAGRDSWQLANRNADKDEGAHSFVPHYPEYSHSDPLLILLGDDGKPLIDVETQVGVRKILRGRGGLLTMIRQGPNAMKRKEAMKLFKQDCRAVGRRVAKAITEEGIDNKTAAWEMVNDMFTYDIPGADI
ncbi:hypothetical protein BU26DRAFT_564620 [Trematosphaeria pertusa]|uniref:Uncharacterized protein n=1 Tax=Trematosphaeria pertusa TaxID=390896 RepID=A0A6A6IFG2_9PLEO|nr:uncharacterized protein BU26DRAFT_564620 [Trematosphaeria pertusa]KAF2248929.1 hypothetical protein BU26DRAFT_564620 [Trematosphaeria pertusa]